VASRIEPARRRRGAWEDDRAMRRRTTLQLLAGGALLAAGFPHRADAIAPVYSNWRGLAIRGFDPVAYFTEGRPVEGSSEHTAEWMGATWRFASAANRDRFVAGPERYAPRYGGYCAYAVAKGETASIDPEAWKIVDGKLYLNYSRDIQETWEKDIPGYVEKADRNWPKLRGGS
jgi:YHS domain-containing protein